MSAIIYDEILRGGAMWSMRLKRGYRLRLTDIDGGANLSLMLHNAEQPLERYNMPDTLKGQHTAHITTGCCLYSDMGRVLMSVVSDDLGWHDTVTGCSNAASVVRKYGTKGYQEHRNDFHRNAYDNFLTELGKYGLGERDMTATLNLFSKVQTDEAGALHFVAAHSPAGAGVTLRADMNVLVTATAVQHPMHPGAAYDPKRVGITVLRGEAAVPADDVCRARCDENDRAFANTELYFA
ncbi:MAG: urea carboxylase-associated family protein [Planctomycetota bacterium]|jgi:urea carboxylase-associated protein 2|nr:urea carboxylase-associated family protein [Planctomycetota bacterium]